jgi:hypothetical protein
MPKVPDSNKRKNQEVENLGRNIFVLISDFEKATGGKVVAVNLIRDQRRKSKGRLQLIDLLFV